MVSPATVYGFLGQDAFAVVARMTDDTTTALSGRQLGVYELKERIGAGGMGEVYRAHDTRLGRDVAIKILPRGFTGDADRQARFEREARVLAALNHPNIGAVYGLEEGAGESGEPLRGIVLELVHGDTLAELVQRGPVRLGDALAIAKQIADALEAAHEKGIVHRDLKPANIKIAHGGLVKVLDFGLAKTIAPGAGSPLSSSLDTQRTTEGLVLGTVAYMSPEQARGRAVDRQTDIWAFGCVLYEMLTGRRAFPGDTTSDTLAAVLDREPDWGTLPAATPPGLVRVLERCLAKDVKRRLRDIGDVRLELEEAIPGKSPTVARTSHDRADGAAARPRRRLAWSVIGGALIASAVLAWDLWPDASGFNPLEGATFTRLTDWEGSEQQAAISRDGRYVAFISDRTGRWDAWVGQIGTDAFNNLTNGQVQELRNPAVPNVGFIPDGSLVTLWVRLTDPVSGVLTSGWVVPTLGGALRPYMDRYAPNIADVDWAPDGLQLVYHTSDAGDPMFVVGTIERTGRRILAAEPGIHNHFPVWSPDAQFIYFVRGFPPDEMDVWRIRPAGGGPERLTFHDSRVAFLTFIDARTLLYVATAPDGSGPWIHALDVERLESQRLNTGVDEYTSIDASDDGRRLVGTVSRSVSALWRAPIEEGAIGESQATRVSLPTARGLSPRLGPNYLIYRGSTGGTDGLWKIADDQPPVELWSGREGRVVAAPALSPDGQQIAFPVRRRGATTLYVMNADGSNVRAIAEELDVRGSPAWSPDGQWIAIAADRGGQPVLFKIPSSEGAAELLVKEYALDPTWSPSGRFLVYSGADVGMTFPVKAVSADGEPYAIANLVLTRGARRLVFMGSDEHLMILKGDLSYKEIWAHDLATGRERPLTDLGRGFTITDFDVSPDGSSIVFDRSREDSDIVLIERPVR